MKLNLRLALVIFLTPILLAVFFAVYYEQSQKELARRLTDAGIIALFENGMVSRADLHNYFQNPPSGENTILRGLEITSEDVTGLDQEDPEWFQQLQGQFLISRVISHIALVKYFSTQDLNQSGQEELERQVLEFQENLMMNSVEQELEDIKPVVRQEEMLAYYAEHPDEFHREGLRYARHIMLPIDQLPHDPSDPHAASPESIMQRIRNGEDFHSLVSLSQSSSKDHEGLLGWWEKNSFAKPFDQALWSLEVGEVTGPVEVGETLHFIHLLNEQKEGLLPYQEAIPQIEKIIQEEKTEIHRYQLLGLSEASLKIPDPSETEEYRTKLLKAAYARGWDKNSTIVTKTQAHSLYKKADMLFEQYLESVKDSLDIESESAWLVESLAVRRLLDEIDYLLLVRIGQSLSDVISEME